MTWKPELRSINFNLKLYEDRLNKYLLQMSQKGAHIWLKAVLEIIPTWSRASRATFEPLAQSVGFTVSYGPMTAYRDRHQLGISSGWGGLERDQSGVYHFYYRTNLRYLIFNEYNPGEVGKGGILWGLLNDTPYEFQDAGEKAFLQFARTAQLPPLRITSRKI